MQRRFEILLPLRFNDGQPVPDDLIGATLLDLEQRFHAISSETQQGATDLLADALNSENESSGRSASSISSSRSERTPSPSAPGEKDGARGPRGSILAAHVIDNHIRPAHPPPSRFTASKICSWMR